MKKKKEFKITKKLKGPQTAAMHHSIPFRDMFYETYGEVSSIIEWKMDNPRSPHVALNWAHAEGFSGAFRALKNPVNKAKVGLRRRIFEDEDDWSRTNQIVLLHKKRKIIMVIAYHGLDGRVEVEFHFPEKQWDYCHGAQRLIAEKTGTRISTGRINLMGFQHGEFELVALNLPKPEVDLGINYGHSFMEVHADIMKFLKSDNSGLVLLHGITGSGKSTYIYHLVHECPKKMIFIPNNVVGSMTNPEFINFLTLSAKGSVLIVEDAEKVLLKRGGPGDAGVSTLLNMTDGVLGQILQCKVVCTFNIARSELDEALLRKGRLQREHEFGMLQAIDANRLLMHLGKKLRTNKPMTLADIYNEGGGRETEQNVVGFGT